MSLKSEIQLLERELASSVIMNKEQLIKILDKYSQDAIFEFTQILTGNRMSKSEFVTFTAKQSGLNERIDS